MVEPETRSSSEGDGPREEVREEDLARSRDASSGAGPTPRGRLRTADPVTRWLTLAIVGLLILWLSGIVSALVFGLMSPSPAPRTAVERDLSVYSAQIQSGQADAKTWAKYIDTLITAGELSKANNSVAVALKSAKADKSYILAEQARLQLVEKDYAGSAKIADQAMTQAKSEYAALVAKYAASKIKLGATLPDSWGQAALLKAAALSASGGGPAAIKAFDAYLKVSPTDADVLVRRGALKAAAGDKAGAAADFRAALRYIPDYKPALDGLKQIGADAR